jgi:hypothetical protein
MSNNQHLLFQLEQMLQWKKSKKFYAEKLGTTEEDVEVLMKELKHRESLNNEAEAANYIGDLEERIVKYEEDLSRGTGEIVLNTPNEIRSLDDLIEKCNIDTSKWEITKYVQNYWGNSSTPHWQVKAWLNKKSTEQVFQDVFVEFLKEYQPASQDIMLPKIEPVKPYGCLVINKQDAHLNKHDVDGENNMEDRFAKIIEKTETIISQARLSNNLDQIVYVIGSDEFNSEWTNATTKGTPQTNITSYQESFRMVCEHEIRMITLMLQSSREVEVIYVPGNHDEFVGWHLINWLSTFFRSNSRLKFDDSPKYRKYISYGSSAMMFNHGDAIKPSKLAGIFPMEFKDGWSNHNNYYIFTGDKHHELSQDFNGIKFYQIPAFSNAKSQWDDKNGYTCSKGEVTAFMIDLLDGMTNIFKQYL